MWGEEWYPLTGFCRLGPWECVVGEGPDRATKRARDAPALTWTGEESEQTLETGVGLWLLESPNEEVTRADLVRRPLNLPEAAHGQFLYNGLCAPFEDSERLAAGKTV